LGLFTRWSCMDTTWKQ